MALTSHTRVYLGNMPVTTNTGNIVSLFNSVGVKVPESDITIPIDRENGMSKGFAFVELHSAVTVMKARKDLQGTTFGGRILRVWPAHSSTAHHGTVTERAPDRLFRAQAIADSCNWTPSGGTVTNETSINDLNQLSTPPTCSDTNPSSDDALRTEPPLSGPTRLWVGGLPYFESQTALEFSMRDLFHKFQISNVHLLLKSKPSLGNIWQNPFCYFTFIDLPTYAAAEQAMKDLDSAIWPPNPSSRPISVRFAKEDHWRRKEQLKSQMAEQKENTKDKETANCQSGGKKTMWVSVDNVHWEYLAQF